MARVSRSPFPRLSGTLLGHPPGSIALRLLPICILVVTATCGPSPGTGGWNGQVVDSAGVVIVENTPQGLWMGSEGWILEEDLRIGGLGGDIPYQFGQVGTIAVDSKGHIYVSDAQAQEVKVFSAAGEYLLTLGRPHRG